MESMRLSIEELAYMVGLLGGGQQAGIFLKSITGELESKELGGRLMAAAHSLIARGWIVLDEKQEIYLDEQVQAKLGNMLRSDFSIRVSKSLPAGEEIVNYFFRGTEITQHRIEQSVISCLTTLSEWDDFFLQVLDFLDLIDETDSTDNVPLITLPADQLEALRDMVGSNKQGDALKLLANNHLDEKYSKDLVRDMAGASWRGSVLKLIPQGEVVNSENGFLILKSPYRIWLFEILSKDQTNLNIWLGTKNVLYSLLKSLTS